MEPIRTIPLSEMYTAVWGKQGEHNAVQLSFDLTGWENAWPDGGPAVAFRRADGKEYAHTFARNGDTLLIPILDYDTEIAGSCAVVISWIDNDNEARSVIINGRINASIVSLGETPTAPEKGLIEQLNAAAASANASQTAAQEAQTAAQTYAEETIAAAERVKDDLFVIRVTVDDSVPYPGTFYKADKSYDEILAAVAAGKACILTDPDGRVFSFLDEYQDPTFGIRLRFLAAAWNRTFQGSAVDYTGLDLKTWRISKSGNAQFALSPAYAPNPRSLTFKGAVSAQYDGRQNVVVEIPEGGSVEQVQSDWNENDETSPAYVKGRTHWVEKGMAVFFPETSFTADTLTDDGWLVTSPVSDKPAAGTECTVAWNGTEYKCPVQEADSEGVMITVIGNGEVVGLTGNGEPFMVMLIPDDMVAAVGFYGIILPLDGSTSATVTMAGEIEVVHPLDPKYIGDLREQKKITITIAEDGTVTSDTPFATAWAMDAGELQTAIRIHESSAFKGDTYATPADVCKSENKFGTEGFNSITLRVNTPDKDTTDGSESDDVRIIVWQTPDVIAMSEWVQKGLPYKTSGEDWTGRYLRYNGNAWYPRKTTEMKTDLGLSALNTANAGKLLYIDADGNAQPLSLGDGMAIVDGVLTLTGATTQSVAFVANDDGSVTLQGATFAQLDDSSVQADGATFTQQDDGSVAVD